MPNFWNSNGLVKGLIPAGKPCPFYANCGLNKDNCPSPSRQKECDFSCGAARAHSLCMRNNKGNTND